MEALRRDWRTAPIETKVRTLLAFAEKMTLGPAAMDQADVRGLRGAGWTDREIHDGAQVAAYFNYINRVADALGVDLEPEMKPPAIMEGG